MKIQVFPFSLAAVGDLTAEIEKPVGEDLEINLVSVYASQATKFARVYGWLVSKSKSTDTIGVCDKWVENAIVPRIVYEGKIPWPNGWKLALYMKTQNTNEKVLYTIGYTIMEPEKPRRWW